MKQGKTRQATSSSLCSMLLPGSFLILRVVGLLGKLAGSLSDTFNDSNHEDAMTRSPLSAPSARCCFFSSTSRLVTSALFILLASQVCSAAYYGKLIGKLSQFHHGVSGEVYAVDGRTLHIKDFTYDGEGPAAYFYVGNSKNPNANGFRVRDERGKSDVLKGYRKKDVTLTLPEGKTLNNIKWFSVYCDEFAVNFGDVRIPRGFDYPRPQKLAALNGVHGVNSEPIVVVDAQTLLIPGFSYDGEAPDAKFWVGSGPHPSPQGVRVPDENGKFAPLRLYQRKTIVLTLPGDLTVHQLGHFGVWCEAFTVDFGHVQIPSNLNVPPSLKMLGVSPQSKLNCEVLEDSLAFEVRWAVAGDSIVVQLVGKLDVGQYMSFGVSATPERSVMVKGDVVVAWVDKETLQGYAIDYYLDAKSQCSGGRGSCPDIRIRENTNSVRLLNAAMVNGYSIVTYQRPLRANDELDWDIITNGSQAIIWAVGPLNERKEVSFHSHYLKTDKFIEFARPPAWNCPMPDGDMTHHTNSGEKEGTQELVATTRRPQRLPATPAPAATKDAWVIPPIQCNEPEDGILFAQMGPTGGKHGYPAITGHVGWGISWYINGLLIPEIYVVRGRTYTFVVESGMDADIPARYHPFYITDDPIGGYQHKTPEEKAKVKIFAGVRRQRGAAIPTGVGRYCNWSPDPDHPADDYSSFGAYQRTLTLKCDSGEPGYVEWTPDANTPDTVYYQCFTHRYLGWKIHVVDSCDLSDTAASSNHEVYAAPPQLQENVEGDLESGASIRVTSKVTPAPEFYDHHHHHHHHNLHHRNPQSDKMLHYQLNQHHPHYNSHYVQSLSQKNLAINPAGNLIATNTHNNNNKIAQLTSTRGSNTNGGGASVEYEHRDPYELMMQSYEEQFQSLPMRPPLYQSTKPILMQQNHHHHHHMLHHLPPHHALGGMRAQQSHMDGFSLVRPHPRVPSLNHASAAAYYREIQAERGESSSVGWPSYKAGSSSSPANSDSVNVVGHQQTSPELDQEVHQSVPVPVSAIASSNQPSNLVPDQRPIMSYGQMKYNAYPHPGSAHYLYSRPAYSNPHKTSQLMILRRPIIQMGQHQQPLQRRPMLGSIMMPGAQEITANQPRPVFMERKKGMYHVQNHKNIGNSKNVANHQTKLTKMENKQRVKIESKMSTENDAISVDRSPGRTSIIKPAKNTGFDPDSIVIESGFRPIIRNIERDTSAGRSQDFGQIGDLEGYQMDEMTNSDEEKEKIIGQENFEPMFVPSPPDRNSAKKQHKKKNQRATTVRIKTRLDDLDDMEMAADRLDGYYLPPSGASVAPKRIEDRLGSSGTLIAFDGKRVKDSNLARSIPRVEEKRSRSRLTSDVLSRTPQFGTFRGELPPPIPGNVRTENIPQLGLHGANSRDHDASQFTRGITKLTPLARSKRSPNNRQVHANVDGVKFVNLTNVGDHEEQDHSMNDHSMHDHSMHDRSMHDHSMHDHSMHDHSMHDHSMHDHSMHDHSMTSSSAEYNHVDHNGHNHTDHDHHEKTTLSSTGQMVINEMPYILLTIVLYFTI